MKGLVTHTYTKLGLAYFHKYASSNAAHIEKELTTSSPLLGLSWKKTVFFFSKSWQPCARLTQMASHTFKTPILILHNLVTELAQMWFKE